MATIAVNPAVSDSYFSIEGQSRLTPFEAIYLVELAYDLAKERALSREEVPAKHEIVDMLRRTEDAYPGWHFYDYETWVKNTFRKD